MENPILRVSKITKRFGGFAALSGVDLEVGGSERVALIGPNGSGKSTFVNCITGTLQVTEGKIDFQGHDVTSMSSWRRARLGMSRSFQIPRPFSGMTVKQNVEIPLCFAAGDHNQDRVSANAQEILSRLGLAARAEQSPRVLSQVELRKLELARALAGNPRILIADECMAGLSDSEVDEIVDVLVKLNSQGIAIIMIEHIMRAVVRFAERVVVLVAGEKIAEGAPREVMSHPEVVRAYLGQ